MDHIQTMIRVLLGALIGGLVTFLVGKYRAYRASREVQKGGRYHTVSFCQCWTSELDGSIRFHVKDLGSLPLDFWMPNQHAREHLVRWAQGTKKHESVIPMPGPLGSFILNELWGLVGMVSPKADYPLEQWILVPIFETFDPISVHSPTVLLLRLRDVEMGKFARFADAKDYLVQHSEHGAKILTSLEVEAKFLKESKELKMRRDQGLATQYLEEMWTVVLRLDTEVLEPTPDQIAKGFVREYHRVAWEKYAKDLALLGLQT